MAHFSISDSPDIEEVGFEWGTALPASELLADRSYDATVRRLDELERLQASQPVSPLLRVRNQRFGPPKIPWELSRPFLMPVHLDMRIENFRSGFAGQLGPHECIECVDLTADDLDVLLRHCPRSISRRGEDAALHVERRRAEAVPGAPRAPPLRERRYYASTSPKIVSGRTPSNFIASAAASLCRASSQSEMSGTSTSSPTRFEPSGSRKVRTVMPRGPKNSARFGEASQWSTSSTSWNTS